MAHLNFNWKHEAPAGLEYNLYEDGVKIVEHIAALNFSLDMTGKPEQTYSFYVTSIRLSDNMESVPSEAVSVNFISPAAPTGLTASFAG